MTEIDKPTLAVLLFIIVSQLILFALKVFNVIQWGWGWIFAPLWIPYFSLILFGLFIIIYLFTCNVKERIFKKHGRRISDRQES